MQIYMLAALKGFWLSGNRKVKKINLPKLSLLQDHTEENAKIGDYRQLSLFSSDLVQCSTVSFQRNA